MSDTTLAALLRRAAATIECPHVLTAEERLTTAHELKDAAFNLDGQKEDTQ